MAIYCVDIDRSCFSKPEWLSIIEQILASKDEFHVDKVLEFLASIVIDEAAARDDVVRILLRERRLTPAGMARLPSREELDRRARDMLRSQGVDPERLCEGEPRLVEESPPGTLALSASGATCNDGIFANFTLTIGPHGYQMSKVQVGRNW